MGPPLRARPSAAVLARIDSGHRGSQAKTGTASNAETIVPSGQSVDLAPFLQAGTLLHGHPCPPLVLGVRAGALAMARLEVGRALDRELFALVELGSDHYAQGFADGIQLVTGCTFGKELIARVPHGKLGVRLVDQTRRRAVRVVVRREEIASFERSRWFRACTDSGRFGAECAALSGPAIAEILAAREDALFVVSPVFPMGIDDRLPSFTSVVCDECGENVLEPYARMVEGRRLCGTCDENRMAKKVHELD